MGHNTIDVRRLLACSCPILQSGDLGRNGHATEGHNRGMSNLVPDSVFPSDSGPFAAASAATARQAEMIGLIDRYSDGDGLHATAIESLHLIRMSTPQPCLSSVYQPGLCVAVQGRKRVSLGAQVFQYDPLHFLVTSVTLPVRGEILDVTPERPYLCVRIDVDLHEIGDLLPTAGRTPRAATATPGIHVAPVTGDLLDAVHRLLRLLAAPADAPVLAPLALREIYYRVLSGPLGPLLREQALADSQARRIAAAIDLLKRRYSEPLRIEELAAAAHMSPSSLHHRFKAVTAMSPLQFQKQLRLYEARRLMLAESVEAATAGHRVGYESPSQFSRDYKRLFGAPPRREIRELRSGASA